MAEQELNLANVASNLLRAGEIRGHNSHQRESRPAQPMADFAPSRCPVQNLETVKWARCSPLYTLRRTLWGAPKFWSLVPAQTVDATLS
jgi:hypothetical protein